jgi:hypothetical protein
MRSLLALAPLLLGACTPDPGDSAPGGDSQTPVADPGVTGVIPLFEIERLDSPGASALSAYGWGPMDRVPGWQRWGELWEYMGEVLEEQGECALVDSMVAAYCPDGCAQEEYCAPGGVCEPWWSQLDPGPLRVEAPTLALDYQLVSGLLSPDGNIDDDPLREGDGVSLAATGAELPAFETSTTVPPQLISTLDCDEAPTSGQDFAVGWEPADGESTVTLEIIAVYHAGNGIMIRCDSPDDGEILIPAALIDAYLPHRTPAEVLQITRWNEGLAELGQDRAFALRVGTQQACY